MEVTRMVGALDALGVEVPGSAGTSELECERGVGDFKDFGLSSWES